MMTLRMKTFQSRGPIDLEHFRGVIHSFEVLLKFFSAFVSNLL